MAARRKDPGTVRLDGALTLGRAAELHGRLLTALQAGDRVTVDCDAATDVDVTFLQLLLAARRSADATGKSLTLAAPAGGALARALRRCGLDAAGEPADRAFFGLEQGSAG